MAASVLEALGLRPAIRVTAAFSERALNLELAPGSPTAMRDYAATIHIANEARSPITVAGAGWLGADGALLEASLPLSSTVERGDPEVTAEKPVTEVFEHHRAHGGMLATWVWLAGEAKPRTQRLQAGWEEELSDVVARLTAT